MMERIKNLDQKILLSITGHNVSECKSKLAEIENLKITKVALFLEFLTKSERMKVYSALVDSGVKNIPFVHARSDMTLDEYEFLIKKYHTKFFNLHPHLFDYLDNFKGLEKKMLLELGYRNKLHHNVDVSKIGGFCIDFSHFLASRERKTNDYEYTMKYQNSKRLFIANHLNGYSYAEKRDVHFVKNVKQLDYLKDLPRFLFGRYIALEMDNSIKEQLKYKKYVLKILG